LFCCQGTACTGEGFRYSLEAGSGRCVNLRQQIGPSDLVQRLESLNIQSCDAQVTIIVQG